MTKQLRENLKIVLNAFAQQRDDLEICMDKIIDVFQEHNPKLPTTNQEPRRRSNSIFDGCVTNSSTDTAPKRRSNTFNGQGLVQNTNTMLYNNLDID